MTDWSEPNLCDGCKFHAIEHRCWGKGNRLMYYPKKRKCKHREAPSNPKEEARVESKIPYQETLEWKDDKT